VTSTFAAARSADAHGDDFTAFLSTALHPHKKIAFAPFFILIKDPEGNMVRSVDLTYSLYRVYLTVPEVAFFGRDPADARDDPAGDPSRRAPEPSRNTNDVLSHPAARR
jgi:hypothetical protein